MDDLFLRTISDWMVGERRPESPGPHPVFLLLHGWTGDENSMWIFGSRLPKNGLLIAPRGLYPTPSGGYGWNSFQHGLTPHVNDYSLAVEALIKLLTVQNFPTADFSRLNLIGFSQGAVVAYTFLLTHPELVRSIAGLAGFLPDGAAELATQQRFHHKPVFIAHGRRDDVVPVERSRQAVAVFEEAGAQVTYCEDDVGHKLSASCFRELEAFFSKLVFGGP
jgi:phospholipase/carboxylesterase